MTDHLAAEADRWLAAEVRTTWPGVSGDCCDAGERADIARWFADQIRAFSHWLAQVTPFAESYERLPNVRGPRSIYGIAKELLDNEFIPNDDTFKGVCKEIHNAALAGGWRYVATDGGDAAVCPVTASEPPDSTRTAQDTNRSAQSDVVNTLLEAASAAAQARTLPPPKPGTHESDLNHPWGGWDDYDAARAWSTANRQENA